MAHDTYFMNNLTGCNKSDNQLINENISKIDLCVCLTEWHKREYSRLYPNLKFEIVNNGIAENNNSNYSKIKNTFIYTSGSFRGLERVLELFPEILNNLPDATLSISSYEDFPKNDLDLKLKKVIDKYPDSIKHLGKLNKTDLYKLMEKSEYWLYPCCFDETSCITAMEMMSHEVLCLYYPRAGLTDTMNNHGIKITHGNEIDILLSLSVEEKQKNIELAKEYSKYCCWKYRSKQWMKILKRVVFLFTTDYKQELLTDYINSLYFSYDLPNAFNAISTSFRHSNSPPPQITILL
jgi:hypothetical protein